MRIRRGSYAIEHVMPQAWVKHWPLPPGGSEPERDARIHRLGNLTLLTKKLNSTVSNGPWLGDGGKAAHLQEKDVVLLNSKLLKEYASKQWDEAGIDQRTGASNRCHPRHLARAAGSQGADRSGTGRHVPSRSRSRT